MLRLLCACVVSLAWLASAPRTDVLVVDASAGPGFDFLDLQPAIDAAAQGDVLLVRAGNYGAFVLSKALTLSAEAGAAVQVVGSSSIAGLALGSEATVRGIDFRADAPASLAFGNHVALTITSSPGAVWLEDCKLHADTDDTFGLAHGLHVVDSGTVFLLRANLRGGASQGSTIGGSAALRVEGAVVAIHDSKLVGGLGPYVNPTSTLGGADALELERGFVYASGGSFRGGKGAKGIPVFGCQGGDGGDAAHLFTPAAEFWAKGTLLIPGSGGSGPCGSGAAGGSVTVDAGLYQPMPGLPRSFQVSSPVRELQPLTLAFQAEPFEPVFLLIGTEPFGWFDLFLGGSLLVGGALQIFPLGTVDGAGNLSLVLPLPPLAPGLAAEEYYLQAAYLNTSGVALLGAGSVLVGLDASL